MSSVNSTTGTVTSGIGLVSGINTGALINSLIAIDAQPQTNLKNQVTVLQAQSTAFQTINAQMLALQSATSALTDYKLFQTTTASSSNSNVLTATTTYTAAPGTYTFNVASLVNTQQTVTNGYTDLTNAKVGAGTLSFASSALRLDSNTALAGLNGGQGISRGQIRITDASGNTSLVDLSEAVSVNDVLNAINNIPGINVTASVDGDHFKLTDNSGGAGTLKVANVGTTNTATSLGLTSGTLTGNVLAGAQVNYISNNTLLAQLNDGNGVQMNASGSSLTFSNVATSFNVNFGSAKTIGDIINAINTASQANGNLVTAGINSAGTGLQIGYTDPTPPTKPLTITGTSAADLGIAATNVDGNVTGTRLIAGLNSKLVKNLNGGTGAALGVISIINRNNVTTSVDLSAAASISDIIKTINSANVGVTAALNNAGDGLLITDTTGKTVHNLTISGAAATALGISVNAAVTSTNSGNLHLRYVSGATQLSTLNSGKGVALGKFTITDSRGISSTVDLSSGVATVQDVLDRINKTGLQVTAQINSTGDGILIQDTGPKTQTIRIAEAGSTTAQDLNILGTAASAGASINGAYTRTVVLNGTETLQGVADKINAASLGIRATIINDGSASAPYRLSLTATQGGTAGAFVFDDGGLNMGANNLVDAKNAVVFFGSSDPAKAVAIVSSSNTLTSVVTGATIDLQGVSTGPVSLNIAQDNSAVTTAANTLVTSFNNVITALNKYDTYDSTTQQRGLLLGDSTISRIRNSLYNMVNGVNSDLATRYNSLVQLGVTVTGTGQLQLDSTKLTAALQTDSNAVKQLFIFKQTSTDSQGNVTTTAAGVGVRFDQMVKNYTDSVSGVLKYQQDALSAQINLDNQRITDMQTMLDAKKAQLQAQYANMETVLAQLQTQSSALASLGGSSSLLSSIAPINSSSSSSTSG